MSFQQASSHRYSPAPTRRVWLDLAPVAIGSASLGAAIAFAVLFRVEGAVFVILISSGLLLFAAMMVLFGRAMTRRWLAFGAALGFAPGARRPFLDLGTDHPDLHGQAGRHPARLRILHTRGRDEVHAWLEVEADLLCAPQDPRALAAHAREIAGELTPHARVRVAGGRVALRAPFDASTALALVEGLGAIADEIERSG